MWPTEDTLKLLRTLYIRAHHHLSQVFTTLIPSSFSLHPSVLLFASYNRCPSGSTRRIILSLYSMSSQLGSHHLISWCIFSIFHISPLISVRNICFLFLSYVASTSLHLRPQRSFHHLPIGHCIIVSLSVFSNTLHARLVAVIIPYHQLFIPSHPYSHHIT